GRGARYVQCRRAERPVAPPRFPRRSRERRLLTLTRARSQCRSMITLYHHPFTRAATVVWMLEEVGTDYQLEFVDVMAGAHKAPHLLALNPMGKLPILKDDDLVVTESAAIGLYL